MGKVKVEIARLEKKTARQVTYSKRRTGILKKAKEISILCDIDVALVMFSPTGKPTLCLGEHSNLNDVVGKFAQQSPEERGKRKLEGLEALKKAFQKSNHQVNIQDFLPSSNPTIVKLSQEARELRTRLEGYGAMSCHWRDPVEVDDVEYLNRMEVAVREALAKVSAEKENFMKRSRPSEGSGQIENGMQLPVGINQQQQSQQFGWGTQQAVGSMDGFDQLSELPCQQYDDLGLLRQTELVSQAPIGIPNLPGNYQTDEFGLPSNSFDWASSNTSAAAQTGAHNAQLQAEIQAQRQQMEPHMNAQNQMLSGLMTMMQAPSPSCSNGWNNLSYHDHNPGAGGPGCAI